MPIVILLIVIIIIVIVVCFSGFFIWRRQQLTTAKADRYIVIAIFLLLQVCRVTSCCICAPLSWPTNLACLKETGKDVHGVVNLPLTMNLCIHSLLTITWIYIQYTRIYYVFKYVAVMFNAEHVPICLSVCDFCSASKWNGWSPILTCNLSVERRVAAQLAPPTPPPPPPPPPATLTVICTLRGS